MRTGRAAAAGGGGGRRRRVLATQLEEGGGVHELEGMVDGGWDGGGDSGLLILGGTMVAVLSPVSTV